MDEFRTVLAARFGLNGIRMILFGSKARGDSDEESDVDLAVIVNNLDRPMKQQIIDILAKIEVKHCVVIGAWVVSSEAFDKLLNRERRIALDIQREGITL